MTQWNFSLRTMFVVMLVVASFCTGWVCKERWDRPPDPTPVMSPTQARRVLKLLNTEHAQLSWKTRTMEAKIDVSADGIEDEYQRADLARMIAIQDLISQQIDQVKASFGGTSKPLWIVKAALLVSMLVLSCAVGIRIGKHLAQHGSRVDDN